jgi:allantoinase
MPSDRIIRGRSVLVDGRLVPAAIHVAEGRITDVTGYDEVPLGAPVSDAGDALVLPGVVDSHVHINEPGRSEWEGFASATRAAAAGGITTLCDMPLNSIPPTTSADHLRRKAEAARDKCWVDVAFWGGVVPGNVAELEPMLDAGAAGFKCFLLPSGVDEFAHVDEAQLRLALPVLAAAGAPLLVHAELPGPIAAAEVEARAHSPVRYLSYLASRPPRAEDEAVAMMIRLSRETGARVHIVHHASASGIPLLAAARDHGVSISAETCPHYLHFAAESIPDGATIFKCAPPIREQENREQLWDALRSGLLDMVVSDHSPCTPELKRMESGDFFAAWGGIASLELALPAVWTEARRRGVELSAVSEWMSARPARLLGLENRKGTIARGRDADLLFFDPEAERVVDAAHLHHKNRITPYHGETLRGVVLATFLRGEPVYQRAQHDGQPRGVLVGVI